MDGRHPLPRLAFGGARILPGARMLPEETAVALSFNGTTRAVMMATPADLEDFARGFAFSEGIAAPEDLASIEAVTVPRGIDLQIWLQAQAGARLEARRRAMAGPVGCGLCGIDSLEQALREQPPVPASAFRLTPAQVMAAVAALPGHQPLHDATHAAHCAAFWREGRIVAAREDVGRHNALDKLIGHLLAAGRPEGAVLLTSRVSIDLVQKVAAYGAPVIIAVSAPTADAVALADRLGIALIALARPDRFEVFSHSDRIATEVPHELR